tara:strand:- start:7887 stop:8852 length:966 start_codon:yes stop_codon:yes gene_type:complete
MKNKILIVCGDPNSISSELIFKSWNKINRSLRNKIYLIGSFDLLQSQFKKLKYKIKLKKVININEKLTENYLKIIDVKLEFSKPFKVNKIKASKYLLKSLDLAHKISVQGNISGIINCPIDKNLLGKEKIGVTEYLASKCKVPRNSEVMLIKSNKLSVSPITTHLDIKEISKKINKAKIQNKIKTIVKWYKRSLKINPKIAVLGLNPHNAELRKNSEEKKIIIPTISKLKKLNFDVWGPFVADTLFIKDYAKYDVIIGMYHDQVLAPFKALFKFKAINITLGLKYLRASPDHGIAVDLIGKNKANPLSMIECIKFINKFGS